MKSILLSIKPQYVAKILNGDATLFISKNEALYKATKKLIEEQGYATFFMYCTKNGYGLIKLKEAGIKPFYPKEYDIEDGHKLPNLNGKVVAKFTVRKVEEITWNNHIGTGENDYFIYNSMTEKELLKKSCLTFNELDNYLKSKNGYAYHIEDLVIFDEPKELWEFKHWVFYKKCETCPYGKCENDYGLCSQCCEIKPLTKAPQNFCYVESEE